MKNQIPIPAIIAIAVVVLLIVGFFGYRALNPDTSPTGVGADGKKIQVNSAAPGQMGGAMVPGRTGAAGNTAAPMSAPNN